ncbi:MAG: hypothetical protein ACREM6_10420, partial [Vulcanimicrobiaceae bacterium]
DRAGALAELAAFSRRVRVELNIEPMAETLALGRLLSRRAPERTVEPAAFGSLGVYALAN